MRRLVALFAIVVLTGCSGVQVVSPFAGQPDFSASVVQPTGSLIFAPPGQTVIIIVELVPVNGFILAPPVFFNDFIGVNPNLGFFCPGIIGIQDGLFVPSGGVFFAFPAIQITVTPLAFGTCTLPLNLGLNGTTTLDVSIANSGATTMKLLRKP